MVWIVTGVVLGVLAFAALGALGLRVWRELRALAKEVGRVTSLLTESAAPLQAELAQTQSALGQSTPGQPKPGQSAPATRDESLSAVR